MAIRNIRKNGDDILRKQSKAITQFNESIKSLAKDMADTMYESNGVGLAASQVGVLKRIIVVDDGTSGLITIINPVIDKAEGEQNSTEGCLSVPGYTGHVKRPEKVIVSGFDEQGKKISIEGKELMATILCHEIDHLNGILFIDKAYEVFENEGQKKSRRR